MKKILSLIVAVLLISFILGTSVFAVNDSMTITISEDYQTLQMNGQSYSRFNASVLTNDNFESIDLEIHLSQTQQNVVSKVLIDSNPQQNIVVMDISFRDGSSLYVSFLRDDYLDEYNQIINGESKQFEIDFLWPEGNCVLVEREDLLGSSIVLYQEDLDWCDYFSVFAISSDKSFSIPSGSLLTLDGKYYYVDFAESLSNHEDWKDFYPGDYQSLSVKEITDPETLLSLQDAEEKYYLDSFGFFYDDDFTETLSAVFLIFVFALIPLVVLIVFMILAIRTKSFYRKLFSAICLISALELVIFFIVATIIILL